jgi:S1-C subfamily serine protease
LATIDLFEFAAPAVVHINTAKRVKNWYSRDMQAIPDGSGSGFLWDDQGHVVTNFHVIAGADSAQVTLMDHTISNAVLVGYDKAFDLAVLRIDASSADIRPIAIGTSADLKVGQKVFAIGNPFGLDQTLTTGIISGLDREIKSMIGTSIQNVIQTDAAINPGNSGGPLLDSAGRLIGVNTAILSPGGSSAGVGFAVPVDTVNLVVPRILRSRPGARAGMGVMLAGESLARDLGIEAGVLITRVEPGSAAERAGLRQSDIVDGRLRFGDVILELDGREVNGREDLIRLLEDYEVGAAAELALDREGKRVQVSIQLMAIR